MNDIGLKPAIRERLAVDAKVRLDGIVSWNLKSVTRRAQMKNGWSRSKRRSAERGYRQFLALIAIDPNQSLGMAQGPVDEVWHEHLLHSRDYQMMCSNIFGQMIHHSPNPVGRESRSKDSYVSTTLPALRRTFGVRPGTTWPTEGTADAFSQCCNHIENSPI